MNEKRTKAEDQLRNTRKTRKQDKKRDGNSAAAILGRRVLFGAEPVTVPVVLDTATERRGYKEDESCYACTVAGSLDGTAWSLLADRSRILDDAHYNLYFPPTGTRYLRITTTQLPSGCWASLREVKMFGAE